MTTAEPATGVVYDLEGTLLEACSCGVLCPCWVGADPDGGACDAFNAYRFDRGTIRGVDVSGLSFINVCHIPGNVLTPGSWRVVSFVDDRASDEQCQAILDAYHGRLGGPLADLAGLVGEVVAVERAPILHETRDGTGTLRIGEVVSAEMEPFRSPNGATITTLRDSAFSTVPGSPAYVSRAQHHTVNLPEHGMVWSFEAATPSSPTPASPTRPRHDGRRDRRAAPAPGRGAGGHRPGLGGQRQRGRRPLPPRRPARPRRRRPGRRRRLRAGVVRDGGRHDAALGRAPPAAVRRGVGPPGAPRPAAGLLRRRLPRRVGAVRVGGAGLRRRRAPRDPCPPLAGGAPVAGGRGHPRAGRRLPVLVAQGPLPHRLPAPGRLPAAPLPPRPRPPPSGWAGATGCTAWAAAGP
jgi:hypothetical protein